jgi:uncharacterized protein (UPF0332 family)
MLADEFQDTAERLARGTTEGDWRSAVSRAYYAVFHFFRDFFLAEGIDLGKDANAHQKLYRGLNNCGHAALAPIASMVDALRRTRGMADYDPNAPVGQLTAGDAAQKSKALVSAFQNVLTTLSPDQIADGVRDYFRTVGWLRP